MNYKMCYCTLLLPAEKNIAERAKGHLTGISLHKFARAIIQGIDANRSEPVKVFNIINTLNYPEFPQIIFPREKWSHIFGAKDFHIGYINIFGIKYITQSVNLFIELDKYIRSNKCQRSFIIVHDSYYPMMKAVVRLKKIYKDNIVTCLISGDIPGKFGFNSQYKNNLKERMIRVLNQKNLKLARQFDCFVFQTKYMAEGFGVEDKPVKVLECTYTKPEYSISQKAEHYRESKDEKIIFYAGSLREEYGILHLLKAFALIEKDNYRLWIAGGGNGVPKVIEAAKKDNRILFLGFISPQEVIDRQSVSTVLVSPRKSDLSFTKYSFPSKTMECLASGVPYIAHHLACETLEYSQYIIYPKDESDEALSSKIVETCELTDEERKTIGMQNRQFILQQKNPEVMCKRIIELADEMMSHRS